MAENTKIEWAHHTFNPWLGCTKVSPACKHCYAERDFDHRLKQVRWGPNGTRVLTSNENWAKPLKWNHDVQKDYEVAQAQWVADCCVGTKSYPEPELHQFRKRVFCASLADVFEDWNGPILNSKGERLWIDTASSTWLFASKEESERSELARQRGVEAGTMNDVRQRLFALIDATPNLDWLLLTKRPENIKKMWPDKYFHAPDTLEEVRMPVEGFPGYEVSNFGVVYTLRGADRCCFCGGEVAGNKQKRYCSQQCRQRSHYLRTTQGSLDPFSTTAKPLEGDVGEDGHTRVSLYRNGESDRVLIHRIVLTAFDRPACDGEQGRHRDGNPRNNRVDNLCWGTQSENWDDSREHRTHRRYSKLSLEQVEEIRERRRGGEAFNAIADDYGVSCTQIRNIANGKQWKEYFPKRENCWLGVSVENQEYAHERIPQLLRCRDLSPVLFLSCEPLLGPVDLVYPESLYPNGPERCCSGHECGCLGLPIEPPAYLHGSFGGVDWVIAGGESGPEARPTDPEWFRSIRNQCKGVGVPFLFKQWGEWVPSDHESVAKGDSVVMPYFLKDPKLREPGSSTIPVCRVGKSRAGRMLDGVLHDEFPARNG